jgi:hypothetical protein
LSAPRPSPRIVLPALRWSRVTISRLSFCGRRRPGGVTIGPMRMRSVAAAIAAKAIQGSATALAGGE